MDNCLKFTFYRFIELETNDSPKFPIVQTFNNPTNIFLINPNIILYYVSFNKYLIYLIMDIENIASINRIIINRKNVYTSF